ncbi:OmpA family protein [Oceanococcus atlanticus]|uniref:OmpA family protein n=1 Tax=Oceanococcus atlanticus TaxID=1317117 RepID=A0A1Y1SID4_9GAMM|nr:OmpA family protein [Oceanococcus atlanticus]ORE89435.1 OmpA family protein [Oceanococcus atlanticus]RZO84917.1 MAG: OmpA family protein [Oceanococcus sp.]
MGMKTALKAALLGAIACSISTQAIAADSFRDKYFTVAGYFYDPDDERGTDREGGGADVAFGFQLSGPFFAELRAFGVVFENGVGGGADNYNGGFGADLQYLIGKRGQFSAFGLVGAAFAYNDANAAYPDEGVFQANAGIGILSRALTASDIRLRIEARGIYEDYLGGVEDYRIGAGIEIPLDPAEIVVREVGAPVVQQAPVEKPDDYPPRPVDTDHDGVLDNFDVCPGTLPGTRVDRSGCALPEQNVTLQGVHFELDSARLTPGSLAILDQAAAALKGQPDIKVRIAGHTDSLGSALYNEKLSMARAKSVREYLQSHQGIDPRRLSVIGYGEAQPVGSNETEAGRAKNRRVEFELQGHGASPK